MGGTPAKIRAGKERKLPPPAIEFMIPAPSAARKRRTAFAMVMVVSDTEQNSVLQTKALSSHKLTEMRAAMNARQDLVQRPGAKTPRACYCFGVGDEDCFLRKISMRSWTALPGCVFLPAPEEGGVASPPRTPFADLKTNLGLSSVPSSANGNESLPSAKVAPERPATRLVSPLCLAGTRAVPE